MTTKESVYSIMKSRRWINGLDLEWACGHSALRRVRELREQGYVIKKRKASDGTYDYRLAGRRSQVA